MALLDTVSSSADLHFQRTAARLLEEATPKPPLEPLLRRPQPLARISPQPDRLMAVRAARVPLLEAARPLLEILARVPAELDVTDQEGFHRALVREVVAFQSIAQDARLPSDDVLMASYLLCAALDEAVGRMPWGRGDGSTRPGWQGRLSVEMHRAGNGGEGFFLLLGGLTVRLDQYLDLTELMVMLLALGFEGMYAQRHNGLNVLRDIRHQVFTMVHAQRRADASPRWRAIEHLLRWRSLDEVLTEIGLEELFS